MASATAGSERFEFVRQLARDLGRGEISLPSFPAIVIKIRDLLEDDDCDFGQVSKIVSADAVLVSRLLIFANSAYYSRSAEKIDNLETAIVRLGLEEVRNTALTLAVRQLVLAEDHDNIVGFLREIWAHSMRLASMSHAVAEQHAAVNAETAFMCGLLHEIGKLYILTKAKDFPDFLGDEQSIREVLNDWHPQIGRSIVESWGFQQAVIESMDPGEFMDDRGKSAPKMVDVVYVACMLLEKGEEDRVELLEFPAFKKLELDEGKLNRAELGFQEKLASLEESLA